MAELDDRMSGTPTFRHGRPPRPGEAGSNGMNTAVVIRTTAGLADWLAHTHRRDGRHRQDA